MAKNVDDKKTALKLINKYADSYNILEEENKSLRSEIKDLKANLKINKEIIEGFFGSSTKKDQYSMYVSKLKEEILKLSKQIENISIERNEFRSKVSYLEQTTNEAINREREENEKNKNKLFLMDNALIKKDSIIMGLRKKLEKFSSDDDKYDKYSDKEIFVTEPTQALNQIHDELLLYKQIYENLISHIKDSKDSRLKYENLINELQNENAKLRTQIKLQKINVIKEKEIQFLKEKEEFYSSGKQSPNTRSTHLETDPYSRKYSVTQTNSDIKKIPVDLDKLKNKLKISDDLSTENTPIHLKTYNNLGFQTSGSNQSEEWIEILRHSGLTLEEMERLSKNKMLSRVIEAIEMLNRLLCDKNLQVRLLSHENESLNQKNFQLNKENINLFQQTLDLKKEVQRLLIVSKSKKSEIDVSDSSIVNNTSKITINNLNINSLSALRKKSDKNPNKEKDMNLEGTASFGGVDLAEVTKNLNVQSIQSGITQNNQKELPKKQHSIKSNKIDTAKNESSANRSEKLTKEYLNNYKDIIFNNGKKTSSKYDNEQSYEQEDEEHEQEILTVSNEYHSNNDTIEYKKKRRESCKNSNQTKSYSEEESQNDSIIYTKNINSKNSVNINSFSQVSNKNTIINTQNISKGASNYENQTCNSNKLTLHNVGSYREKDRELLMGTLESCTSSEFRAGLEQIYEQSFLSQGNNDIENLKIEIKPSNV